MTSRLEDDMILARFREVEATLDAELDACRSQLEAFGFDITDTSNRGGFEKTGVPYFVWSYNFDLEARTGELVDLVRVQLEYQQPSVGVEDDVSTFGGM